MLKCNLPPMLSSILDIVEEKDRPKGEQIEMFWKAFTLELLEMIEIATRAQKPEICLTSGRKEGRQYVWEFWVNDLAIELKPGQLNWHGQNTSQWLYAGAICLTDGRVSRHH